MKKFILIITLLVLVVFIFSSCDSFNTTGRNQSTTTETTTEKQISASQKAANELPDYLKQILKNPESLQIHEVVCFKGDDIRRLRDELSSSLLFGGEFSSCDFLFSVDASAQNGFGGMNRETYLLYYSNDSGFEYIDKNSNNYDILTMLVGKAKNSEGLGENLSVND